MITLSIFRNNSKITHNVEVAGTFYINVETTNQRKQYKISEDKNGKIKLVEVK